MPSGLSGVDVVEIDSDVAIESLFLDTGIVFRVWDTGIALYVFMRL